MSEQPLTTLTVPTEMEREDKFIVLAVLFGSPLAAWELWLNNVPVWMLVPPMLATAIWVLTSESVVDVDIVGPIAGGLRSKLGLRRAHEWLFAYGHYFKLVEWPKGKERWQRSRLRSAIRTWAPWLKLPNVNGAAYLSRLPRYWSKS